MGSLSSWVELVNGQLADGATPARLCEQLPTYVRYGVDSELALRLLISGVRSRRLAHAIARAAATEEVEGDSLRRWLGEMEIAELRRRFSASSSELLDILEFTRTPRASVLRDLLEQGRAEVAVRRIVAERSDATEDGGQAEGDRSMADESTAAGPEGGILADLRPVPGEELPSRLGVFGTETGQLIALVPTPAYGDVQGILDTGVPITGTLRGEMLEVVLAPETTA